MMKKTNVQVETHTNRALNGHVHEFGTNILNPELNEEFAKEILQETAAWEATHKFKRKMNLDEL